jgi:site-specific DNA recombinase
MVCGLCGLHFVGQANPRPNGIPTPYYSCGGKIASRSPIHVKCQSKFIRAPALEDYIWAEIDDYLRNPGPVLAQLAKEMQSSQTEARGLEQERVSETVALSHKEDEKQRILDLYRHRYINETDLTRQLEKIAEEEAQLKARLAILDTTLQGQEAIQARLEDARDLLETLRQNLKDEFTWDEKRALVEILVLQIRVDTIGEGRAKRANITVDYAFGSSRLRRAQNHTDIHADSCATLSRPVQLPT